MIKISRRAQCLLFTLSSYLLSTTLATAFSLSSEPIQPIPHQVEVDSDKVELGDKLFHDPRLSKDDSISCASCHDLNTGGVDQKTFSEGVNGAVGGRNSPTVFNSGLNFRQFWDGRAEGLEQQIDGPIHAEVEMATTWPAVIEKLTKDAQYVKLFVRSYDDGITEKNIKDAISEFERSLITPDSPFDRYLRGEKNALTQTQQRGYTNFKRYGCIACHQGVNVGGNMYQRFGVMRDINERTGKEDDHGRFQVTGDPRDKYVFKVPSLRLAARTPPYFHDGSVAKLEDAVDVMIKFQLGRSIPEDDKQAIVQFLHSLVGTYKGEQL